MNGIGFYRKSKPVKVLDNTTKIVKSYASLTKAAMALRRSIYIISRWAQSDGQVLFESRYQIKHANVTKDWKFFPDVGVNRPIVDLDAESYQRHFKPKAILVRDFLTKKVIRYEDDHICGMALGICSSAAHKRAQSKGQVIYKDGFQVKYEDDETPWLDQEKVIKVSASTIRRSVLVRDCRSNEVIRYQTRTHCENALDISKYALKWFLKSDGQKVFMDHFQFKLATSTTEWGALPEPIMVLSILEDEPTEFECIDSAAMKIRICPIFLEGLLKNRTKQPLMRGQYLAKYRNDPRPWKTIYSPVFRSSSHPGRG